MCSHSVQLLMIWAWNFRKPIKEKHNSQYFLSQRNVLFPDYVELRGHHYMNKCVQNARSRSGTYRIRHALSNFSEWHISLYQINTYLLQIVYVWSEWRLSDSYPNQTNIYFARPRFSSWKDNKREHFFTVCFSCLIFHENVNKSLWLHIDGHIDFVLIASEGWLMTPVASGVLNSWVLRNMLYTTYVKSLIGKHSPPENESRPTYKLNKNELSPAEEY